MNIATIVAYDQRRAIGAQGDLPWGRGLPADLAQFKHLTTGGSIIMGRKTFESIGSRPLPNRENIVVSSTPTGVNGVLTAMSVSSAYALARYPVFIIGGGQLYKATMDDIDVIYATEVNAELPDADTFFPTLNSDWHEIARTHHDTDDRNTYPFDFVTYKKY